MCNDNQRSLFLSLISYNHIGKIVVSTNVLSAKEANKTKYYCEWLWIKYLSLEIKYSIQLLIHRPIRQAKRGKLQIWSQAFLNWSRSEETCRDCQSWLESLIDERWSPYHCGNTILKILFTSIFLKSFFLLFPLDILLYFTHHPICLTFRLSHTDYLFFSFE